MGNVKRSSITKTQLSDRFRESLVILGLTPVTAYELLGYTNPSTIYSINAGRCLPDLTRLLKLSTLRTPGGYRINIDWIITGEGEKLLPSKQTARNIKVEKILSTCSTKKISAIMTLLD